jgi:hypothetical protein
VCSGSHFRISLFHSPLSVGCHWFSRVHSWSSGRKSKIYLLLPNGTTTVHQISPHTYAQPNAFRRSLPLAPHQSNARVFLIPLDIPSAPRSTFTLVSLLHSSLFTRSLTESCSSAPLQQTKECLFRPLYLLSSKRCHHLFLSP